MNLTSNPNIIVQKIISPVFLLAGALGYFIPHLLNFLCTTWHCNLFHINIGILGLIVVLNQSVAIARTYNIILGGILIYLAMASYFHLFPSQAIKYSVVDDIINMDIGATMLLIGILGPGKRAEAGGNNTSEMA